MTRLAVLAVAVCVAAASQALGLGADHPKDELAKRGPNCVHGFFVNWQDVFFFAGDTKALNAFLADLAKQEKAGVQVVLRPGPKKARSPWDKEDRNIPVDWSLSTGGRGPGGRGVATRVDIYLGGGVKLDDLVVPPGLAVVSGGEIDRFIDDHNKKK